MTYLDYDHLESHDPRGFRSTRPYPYLNPCGALTDEGYRRLLSSMPDIGQMQPSFGVRRKHGQQPHDRWVLEYDPYGPASDDWHAFVAELQGKRYQRWIRRMFGRGRFWMNFHWHYAPAGTSVSPHCDSARKIGTHIFYMNDPDGWDPAWGGATTVLDDHGRLPARSAPDWSDFACEITADNGPNRSFLMKRHGHSWHGVRPLACPPGRHRRVFIVVFNDWIASLPMVVRERLSHRGGGY